MVVNTSALRGLPPIDTGAGGQMFALLLSFPEWVHRRVESISFEDDVSVIRRVSVDLELPLPSRRRSQQQAIAQEIVVPLALLRKEPLVNFDLRDENSASLPMLTSTENRRLAWSTIGSIAEVVARGAGVSLTDAIRRELWTITGAATTQAKAALHRLENPAGADAPLRGTLMSDSYLRTLAHMFAGNFLLCVLLEFKKRTRRIIKYSYAEPVPWRSTEMSFAQGMGWQPVEFGFPVPSIGRGASYHFEIEAPEGLQVRSGTLSAETSEGTVVRQGASEGRRLHMYLAGAKQTARGRATVQLRPVERGLLRNSLLMSGICALIMGLAWCLLSRIEARGFQTPAALLLAIPGLIAVLVARPQEPALTTELLRGVRGAVASSAVWVFVGASLLAVEVVGTVLRTIWTVLLVLSLASAGCLWASFRGPQEATGRASITGWRRQ